MGATFYENSSLLNSAIVNRRKRHPESQFKRRKRHEGVNVCALFLGKLTTAWECGSPADCNNFNMCVFVEKY